ncbi:spermidine/putrescine ABC transporter ATP-binding protein, partial [Clostridium perfringens]
NPRNKFVGSFIGSPQMNLLNVEVKGNKAILENGSKITLPEGILKRMNNRQGKLCMGFRAEDIKLDNLNIGLFEDSIITSAIENTEIMGNENNLYFKIGNTTAVARVGKEDVKEIGEQFKFVINVNKVHFFDLDTEENILNLGNTLTLDHN